LLYHRNAKCWKIVRVVMYGNVCKFEVFLIAEITPCHSVRSTVSVVMLTIVPCLGWCKQAGWQSTGKGLHSQDWTGNTQVKHRQWCRDDPEVWQHVLVLEKQREADLVNCCAFCRFCVNIVVHVACPSLLVSALGK